ncbi:MAG: ATP-dependent DNA helicase [Candidatus Paceibacterota bacterium]
MINDHNTTSSFDGLYNSLNIAQKKAVLTIEGPVIVIAGPGTGKTTVLTLRIANILKKTDTAPENILALTFTESGAYNMRRKLAEIIGSSAYKVNINTFHGFAVNIIEKYPDYFPRIIGSSVITNAEQIKIIEKIISKSKKVKLLRPYGDKNYYVLPILKEIQVLKRENISPKDLSSSIKESKSTVTSKTEKERHERRVQKNKELAFVYAEYEKELMTRKRYDFEDMLLELIHAMEKNINFKLILQEEYQYILADEHQDANAAQNRILELLSDFHESPNLFIVGDDKQAIYRFQGASLDNFLFFTEKYKDAVVIDLEHNYRSHQGILDASHSLITKNPTIPNREHKKLISLQIGSAPIFIIECDNIDDELECVAGLIDKMIKRGKDADSIAILYRDNKHAEPISMSLKAYGIPHRIESDYDIMNERESVKIITLCKAINDLGNDESLAKVLFLKELGCDPGDVAKICKEASMDNTPLYKMIGKRNNKDSLKLAYNRIVEWKREGEIMQFTDFLHKLIQETDMIKSIAIGPDSLQRLDSIQEFYEHARSISRSKKSFYLRDFIEYIDISNEHGIKSKRNYTDHINGVRLMTAHRSKGLEFDNVFIIHMVDGIWGNRSSRNLFNIKAIEHARNIGRIEDERRLFYVAMTRARESVNVTYALREGDRELIQSQFLREIDPQFTSFEKLDIDSRPVHTYRIFQPQVNKENISILEPQFIRSKFLAQPLSITHINNYLECPWRYFFVNLLRIPASQSKHQMYGTAVHTVLKIFFDAYREERYMNKKQLISIFKHYLEMQSMSIFDRKESYEKGKMALSGYYDEYHNKWNRVLITEYIVKGISIELGEKTIVNLTGKLDKVEFIDDVNVIVVDYKTGKPKSRSMIEGTVKSSNGRDIGNYKRQLIFYKILLNGGFDKGEKHNWNMKYGEIDFIEPNERGKYKKERFEIIDDDIDKLKKTILSMAQDIISLKFIDKGCHDKNCEYCKLAKAIIE